MQKNRRGKRREDSEKEVRYSVLSRVLNEDFAADA